MQIATVVFRQSRWASLAKLLEGVKLNSEVHERPGPAEEDRGGL